MNFLLHTLYTNMQTVTLSKIKQAWIAFLIVIRGQFLWLQKELYAKTPPIWP